MEVDTCIIKKNSLDFIISKYILLCYSLTLWKKSSEVRERNGERR